MRRKNDNSPEPGRAIRYYRQIKKMTIADLADRLQVPRSTLATWETTPGQLDPTNGSHYQTIDNAAKILGVSAEQIWNFRLEAIADGGMIGNVNQLKEEVETARETLLDQMRDLCRTMLDGLEAGNPSQDIRSMARRLIENYITFVDPGYKLLADPKEDATKEMKEKGQDANADEPASLPEGDEPSNSENI